MLNNPVPLVTIRCLTYNHEPYIRQCLEGFVMQQTNFRFEAIVHDDASTDGTAAIIKEYAEKYPNIIKPIFETENQYSKRDGSLRRIMDSHTRGKYVAMCEGDDYWIDPLKLQKQVDFLESHPDYGLVHGGAKVFYQSRNEYGKNLIGSPCFDVDDLLITNKIVTLTTCFRRTLYLRYVNEIKPLLDRSKMGDYPLWLYIAFHSKLHFFSEPMGGYRVLDESVSHNKNAREEVEFVLSSYSIKKMFVEKYGKKYLLKRIRSFVVETIEKKYLSHDEKCDISLLRANELSIFVSLRSVALYMFSCFNWSRKLYLRKNVNS